MNPHNPIPFAEAMLQTMRAFFEEDGHLEPVAFVIATKDPFTGEELPEPEPMMLPLEFHNNADKDAAAEQIRQLAFSSDAVGVLCGMETWILRTDDPEELQRAMESGLKNHKDKAEIIFVQLEHAAGTRTWTAEIVRDANGKPTLGEFKLELETPLAGRFSNFLPPKREFDA